MQLDHIAVSGESLEEAAETIESALGVAMQPGGRHEVFGTHNRLLGLDAGLYIEAIAIDPSAPRPKRARWFDLDHFVGLPRLTNWICRSEDLIAALSHLPQAGNPVNLVRGNLAWTMAVPQDGGLPFNNLHPALIQWQSPHPSVVLTQCSCALRQLIVIHPEALALQRMLTPVFDDPRVSFENGAPGLVAEIDTPHGLRYLH
ncbi:VOC family protein [Pontibaca salina]|uniref:VOC family protein n=1 Tax=Pontibaca salina TaxID=2795731 RepID=A0A934HRM4_9RHOB|nr:VOC family protein [Pontibaca salina]MBI6629631.1 VOC family protein [Pontibaca salina]